MIILNRLNAAVALRLPPTQFRRYPLRSYATVSSAPLRAYPPPSPPEGASNEPLGSIPLLDSQLLSRLSATSSALVNVPGLAREYSKRAGHILDVSLPYESRPSAQRRVYTSPDGESGIIMVAHCVIDQALNEHAVTVSSGFALNAPSGRDGESLILSCAHTLEEIRRSRLLSSSSSNLKSGSFVIAPQKSSISISPITSIVSSLPRSDLILFTSPTPPLRTLPVSPYPAQDGARVLTHLIHDKSTSQASQPSTNTTSSFLPDIDARWVKSTLIGYRDFAGREAQPGTYDSLAHLLFTPIPTSGSSGGPIVDEESGAVVGVVLGSRTDFGSRQRGFGVPSEAIFEMFSLPGFKGY